MGSQILCVLFALIILEVCLFLHLHRCFLKWFVFLCFGLRPHANTVFGLKVTFGKCLPLFHWCAELLARDVRDCGLTFFIYINLKKDIYVYLHMKCPTGSHWPKFVAHKLWGRDRWWGLEPPQIEHARPRAKYKLELTLGWVCWLWNAGHVFLLIAIHQIQKYLQNLKFVKLHSEDFFPTFWSGAAKTVLFTCFWQHPNTFTRGLRLELDLKSICSMD